MTREELIARLVAIADERPNTPIGHVVEHELPELRAQAEAMPRVTPEMVAAQADIASRLERLADRADARQARIEAMPRIVREGRDFDVKFHDNGAAQGMAQPEGADTTRVEVPAAAPPDLAARVEQLEGLLRELHPYLDSLICYASTRTEYKPNDIVARIDAALAEGE